MQAVFDELNKHLARYTLKQVLNKEEIFDTEGEEIVEESEEEQV
jgi:hypothetical protein